MNMQNNETCFPRCLSWGAIIAGAFVGVGLGFLLNVFGFAIGLSAFTNTASGLLTLAVGGFIGMLIGVIATMFFSGWVSGYLARAHCHHYCVGALYGFITWCLTLMLTIAFTTHVSHFVADNFNHMTKNNMAYISVSNDSNAPVITHESDEDSNVSNTTVNMESAANTVGEMAYVAFILFLVGAFASTIGGYYGVKCGSRRCCDKLVEPSAN